MKREQATQREKQNAHNQPCTPTQPTPCSLPNTVGLVHLRTHLPPCPDRAPRPCHRPSGDCSAFPARPTKKKQKKSKKRSQHQHTAEWAHTKTAGGIRGSIEGASDDRVAFLPGHDTPRPRPTSSLTRRERRGGMTGDDEGGGHSTIDGTIHQLLFHPSWYVQRSKNRFMFR